MSSHYVFSYGSNSTSQLRARVKNPDLETFGAMLHGYSRVFCFDSKSWGGGGVASICPSSSQEMVCGALVCLSDEELKLLDSYERNYRKEKISVVLQTSGKIVDAIAYVANGKSAGQWTPSLTERPSEQYLTAIWTMLREHFGEGTWKFGDSIPIRSAKSGGGVESVAKWTYPGKSKLSLASFAVEINSMKEKKWVMPLTIHEFVSKMERIEVRTVYDLYQALPTINSQLVKSGEKTLSVDTLSAITKIPFTKDWVV